MTSKVDPSVIFNDAISVFTKAATKAFQESQKQNRSEITRAEVDARQARNERDLALKSLHEAKNETQKCREEVLECKTALKEAELTDRHYQESIALLQRETNQWKDQANNWREHFLRVEQERCVLNTRIDELVAERLLIPITTPHTTTKSNPSTSISKPPTYQANTHTNDYDALSSESPVLKSTSKKRKNVPRQSELPPYTEAAQTPKSIKSTPAKPSGSTPRSTKKLPQTKNATTAKSSKSNKNTSHSGSPAEPQQPRQILIRRVQTFVKVKQEDDSIEELSETMGESPEDHDAEEEVMTPRRSRSFRTRIIDDEEDEEYVPDDASPDILVEDDEDDELMIGAGDDLSFGAPVESPPSVKPPATTSKTKNPPNKKRKLNTSSKPTPRRKV